jgi:hypothetical protein
MATIRKRRGKYEVQIRHSGVPSISKSFHVLKHAQAKMLSSGILDEAESRHCGTGLSADRRQGSTPIGVVTP